MIHRRERQGCLIRAVGRVLYISSEQFEKQKQTNEILPHSKHNMIFFVAS